MGATRTTEPPGPRAAGQTRASAPWAAGASRPREGLLHALLGALITGFVEYARLRRRSPKAGTSWLLARVDLQFSTTLALVLFMLVLPWTFFLVGERGLFIVLIGSKAALDTWLAGRGLGQVSAPSESGPRP